MPLAGDRGTGGLGAARSASTDSNVYDRTISQSRLSDNLRTTGVRKEAITQIATGIACSIQGKGIKPTGFAPDDTMAQTWIILTIGGSFQLNDLLTDDLGRNFRVREAYPTPFGWQLVAHDPVEDRAGPA